MQAGLALFITMGTPWCIFVANPDGLTEPILWILTLGIQLGIAIAIAAIAQFFYVTNPHPGRVAPTDPTPASASVVLAEMHEQSAEAQ